MALPIGHPVVLLCFALLGVGLLYATSSARESTLLVIPVIVGLALSQISDLPTARLALDMTWNAGTAATIGIALTGWFATKIFV